jgi:hypothetical protein
MGLYHGKAKLMQVQWHKLDSVFAVMPLSSFAMENTEFISDTMEAVN